MKGNKEMGEEGKIEGEEKRGKRRKKKRQEQKEQ